MKSSKCQSELTRPFSQPHERTLRAQGRCYNHPNARDRRLPRPGHRRGRLRRLAHRRPAARRAGARDRRARQLRARHAPEPRRRARRTTASRWSRASSRTSTCSTRPHAAAPTTCSTSPRCGSASACTSRARRSRSTSSALQRDRGRAARPGVKKVVYSSSASVYGDALVTPMTEDHPFNNRTMYGATKIAGEQFFRAFHEQHGLDYVGLRYMNIYGPRMDYKGAYVSVIMKVLDRIDAGEPPVIFGDGSQAYDFIHVEDVARANILAMKSDATDDVFNVGTGVKTTIKRARRHAARDHRQRPRARVPAAGADVRHPPRRQHRAGRAAARLHAPSSTCARASRSVVEWRRADQPRGPPCEAACLSAIRSRSPSRTSARRSSRRSSEPLETGWVVQGPLRRASSSERFAALHRRGARRRDDAPARPRCTWPSPPSGSSRATR